MRYVEELVPGLLWLLAIVFGAAAWLFVTFLPEGVVWALIAAGSVLAIGALGIVQPRFLSPSRRHLPQAVPSLSEELGEQLTSLAGDRFGPNSDQVIDFLGRISYLTPQHWQEVLWRRDGGSGLRGWTYLLRGETVGDSLSSAIRRAGREQAEMAIWAAIQHACDEGVFPAADQAALLWATEMACKALMARDLLAEKDFAVCYYPFEGVLPL